MGDRDFSLPIGDVVMYGVYKSIDHTEPQYVYEPRKGYSHCAQSQLWWCPPDDLVKVFEAAEPFTDSGFSIHRGLEGRGSKDMPEVIECEWQERTEGSQFTKSNKGVEALVGDTLVWLEIDNADLAYEILQERTDLPCAIRCDMYRYSYDNRYRQVFDIANDYFIYYCYNNKTKDIKKGISDDDYLKSMYDV